MSVKITLFKGLCPLERFLARWDAFMDASKFKIFLYRILEIHIRKYVVIN